MHEVIEFVKWDETKRLQQDPDELHVPYLLRNNVVSKR